MKWVAGFKLKRYNLVTRKRKRGIYYYLQHNYRENGKPKTDWIYLGPGDKALEVFYAMQSSDLDGEMEIGYGGELVLKAVAHSIDLGEILARYAGSDRIGRVLENLIILRALYPESKKGLVERALPSSILKYDTDLNYLEEVYRFMDTIYENLQDLSYEIAKHVIEAHRIRVDYLIIDATRLKHHKGRESELVKWGYDPQEPMLAQIKLIMAVNQEYIPLLSMVCPGNASDIEMFKAILEEIKRRGGTLKKVPRILVFDQGNVSPETVKELDRMKLHYVSLVKTSAQPKYIKQRGKLKLLYTHEDTVIYGSRMRTDVYGRKCTVLVCFNPGVARQNREGLKRKIEDVKREAEKQNRIKKASKERYQAVTELISKHNLKRAIKPKIEGGKVVLEVDDKEVRMRRRRCGYFVIFSDLDLGGEEMLGIYKSRNVIEEAFRVLKTDLEAERIFHSKDRRIETHAVMMYYDYLLISLLKLLLKKKGLEYTFPGLMRIIRSGRGYEGRLEHRGKEIHIFRQTKPSEELEDIFKALKIKIPKFAIIE